MAIATSAARRDTSVPFTGTRMRSGLRSGSLQMDAVADGDQCERSFEGRGDARDVLMKRAVPVARVRDAEHEQVVALLGLPWRPPPRSDSSCAADGDVDRAPVSSSPMLALRVLRLPPYALPRRDRAPRLFPFLRPRFLLALVLAWRWDGGKMVIGKAAQRRRASPASREANLPFGLSSAASSRRSRFATKPLASNSSRSSRSFSALRIGTRASAQRSIGGIAMVVTTAMATIIVNRFWLSAPIESPMVATITSVEPRAFMPQASAKRLAPASGRRFRRR